MERAPTPSRLEDAIAKKANAKYGRKMRKLEYGDAGSYVLQHATGNNLARSFADLPPGIHRPLLFGAENCSLGSGIGRREQLNVDGTRRSYRGQGAVHKIFAEISPEALGRGDKGGVLSR
jgi:hypothetical protein